MRGYGPSFMEFMMFKFTLFIDATDVIQFQPLDSVERMDTYNSTFSLIQTPDVLP